MTKQTLNCLLVSKLLNKKLPSSFIWGPLTHLTKIIINSVCLFMSVNV